MHFRWENVSCGKQRGQLIKRTGRIARPLWDQMSERRASRLVILSCYNIVVVAAVAWWQKRQQMNICIFFVSFAAKREKKKLYAFFKGIWLEVTQCDQIARSILNIWPFTVTKICPMALFFCQSSNNILPITKLTFKLLPKTFDIFSKFSNFTKSGHTDWNPK